MFVPLHCIALRTAKYSDRYSILSVYTREMGRQSLLIPATSGKSASRYRALTMPLSAFECVATVTSGRDVHPIKDLKPDSESLKRDYNNPRKSVVSFFLSEFFYSILKEPQTDIPMYELIRSTAEELNRSDDKATANLHLLTLVRTARVLGIEPDISTISEEAYFDLEEGVWKKDLSSMNRNCLTGEKSRQAMRIARMTSGNYRYYRFNRDQRNEALSYMLKYFNLHGFGKTDIEAVEVLKELF